MLKLCLLVFTCVATCDCFYYNLPKKYSDNNACKTAGDYDTIDTNENCWYNPDADYNVPKIIKSHGYPLEIHKVTTEDGFYLELFRIPNGIYNDNKNVADKQPVYLQHGVISSCSSWVLVGNRSLAFILAEKGYDVWLSNSRGSLYSTGHTTWQTNDPKYWNWSFTEQALYDLPASLDVVISVNGRSDVIYVGQSLGCSLPYIYGTVHPEEARKRMALLINLAPTLFLGDIRNVLKRIAYNEKYIRETVGYLSLHNFFPLSTEVKQFFTSNCLTSTKGYLDCLNILFDLFGPDYEQLSPDTLALIIGQYPVGTSWKNFIHILQQVRTNRFTPYDYGKWKNMELYNSIHPPSFNLSKIKIPSFIMYGQNDYAVTEKSAKMMYEQLPEKTRVEIYKINHFNHMDFVFARDVKIQVYDILFKVMEKYNKTNIIT